MRHDLLRTTRLPALAGVVLALLLAACGGSGGDASPPAPAPAALLACAQLNGLKIDAAKIGLPTTGALVSDAKVVAGNGTGSSQVGEHCLVTGRIKPLDASAPDINFNVALPTTWNSKLLMLGGGGLDGFIPAVAANVGIASPTALNPLGRGYVVIGSDGGNQSQSPTGGGGAFLGNQEAYLNWMGDALKKTRDVANALVAATYGTAPAKAYFVGGSTGGREALAVAARWPAEWDGIVSLYPARNTSALFLGILPASQALAAPGAYLSYAKRGALRQAALAACDLLDGVADGVVSNVQRCNATFDPATAVVGGVPLRCAGGAEGGDSCLSDAQLAALKAIHSEVPYAFQLASGDTSFPGYNVYFADGGTPSTSPVAAAVASVGLGNAPIAFPVTPSMTAGAGLIDAFVRFRLTGDSSFNLLTLDAKKLAAYASQISYVSTLDAVDENLTPFATKGGKVLLMHGTDDLLISPRSTELYYQKLRVKMGGGVVDSFLRFYEVPGYNHGVSKVFNANFDAVGVLENWVEKGVDPGANLVVGDSMGVPGRTRPLCLYPTWPKYKGSGDVNSAASFSCVAN